MEAAADQGVPASGGNGEALTLPPPLPLGVRLQVGGLTVAIDAVERRDGTVNRCLYSVIDRLLSARANPRPDSSGVRSYDFTIDASRGIWARVFAPVAAAAPLPVIVYYHGGGFALFSPAIGPFNGVCRRFCSQIGAVVVSVNYRLAPEHRYPAAYDDGVDALRFIDDAGAVPGLGDDVPVDLSSCFLAGESAGGNIVHHVANRWAAEHQPSAKSVRLAGIFPVQPYFGGEERTESELRLEGVAPVVNLQRSDFSWKAFLPVGATRDHPAAHVTDENAELAEAFPPTMVVVGGFDPLQDWQRRYADVLRRKGKKVQVAEYPDGFHGFYGFPELPDAGKVLQEMKAFVDSNRTAPKSTTP
ncbi:probable carboxylesterase 18 [Lolium rigidum]|uniref:probable carboxylesterase 18 n=1 Tax=Lolium rigidum TaxID=89674 RepID=UPI001F5D5650|nr:probable carboxylesterase 18 [Lolium rigidum]